MGSREPAFLRQKSKGHRFTACEMFEASLYGSQWRSLLRAGEGELWESRSHDGGQKHHLLPSVGLLYASKLQRLGFQLIFLSGDV